MKDFFDQNPVSDQSKKQEIMTIYNIYRYQELNEMIVYI